MKKSFSKGFTLLELLVVVAIISMLVALSVPEVDKMIAKARSATCMGNLKNIGVAVTSYLGEHDQTFPYVEPDPSNPVYTSTNYQAQPMLDELTSYGVTPAVLKCPADVAGPNYYATRTNSYMWTPVADGESTTDITFYGRRGGTRVVKPSRVRIVSDYDSVHFGHFNWLYADGHVRWASK